MKYFAAINKLVQYNWSDEIEDYVENCGYSPEFNQRSGHIFETLVTLANAMDGTKHTPEYWVRDYCERHKLPLDTFGTREDVAAVAGEEDEQEQARRERG